MNEEGISLLTGTLVRLSLSHLCDS